MTFFVVITALLVAGTLLVLLPPLASAKTAARGVSSDSAVTAVCRDQLRELERDLAAGVLARDRYHEARADIERRLLADLAHGAKRAPHTLHKGLAAIVVAIALPLAATAVYWATGSPQSIALHRAASAEAPHALDARQVQTMIGRLAERLERNPADAQGWAMLARSYAALRRYTDAAQAYAQAAARGPADAQLLADYADALAMAQGRRLAGEPEILIARALAADPNHVKALALAASAALEKREYEAAIAHWERLLTRVPAESDIARSSRGSIAQARARLAESATRPPGR